MAEPDLPERDVDVTVPVAPEPAELTDLRARVAELEDRWRRTLADFDNFRKRTARESVRQRDQERARVAAMWLPVIDNLDLALSHADGDQTPFAQGVRAIRDQAIEVLAQLGFPRRSDVGEMFDPSRHEAVAVVHQPDAKSGTILQVVRPGYGTGEHQLRPAAVVVAKGD
jgi:molecular chaperone GrpE